MGEIHTISSIEQDRDFILREQTRLLLDNSKIAIAVNLSIAGITFLAIPSSQHLWLWLIMSAAALRLLFYLWCQRESSSKLAPRTIYSILLALIVTQGAAWGAASIFLYSSASILNKFYLMTIICGMSGGAVLTLAPSLLAFSCFTLPAVIPLVIALLVDPDQTLKHAGFMGVIFLLAAHILARRISSANTDLLRSHYNLERTAADLAEHKNRLEILVDDRTKELKDSRENYRRLTEEINDAIFELDGAGRVKYISPVITSILGYQPENLIGRDFTEMIVPEDLSLVQDLFQKVTDGELNPAEYRIVDVQGKAHWVRTSSRPIVENNGPIGFRGVLTDICREKRAETEKQDLLERFYENQKLEAIGTLAGGIAHDFNNLLMGIQGHASLLAVKLAADAQDLSHIQAIEEHIRSATSLTTQLLGTARGGKYDPKPIDLNELVLNSASMFKRTRKEIQIRTDIWHQPVVAEVDRQQIEQVLLNMYVNAWQAMPDGGELKVVSSILELDAANCDPYEVSAGQYAQISVTDSGVGMDEATQHRVFDPFFTTKEKGRGTGLGMASAYGIIKNHGGFITVFSQVGNGATFNVYLPISDEKPLHWSQAKPVISEGSELILLVDDEELILEVGKVLLENLGYRVIVAKSGEQAIDLMGERGEEIDLILLDMIMPGMDGGMTFDRIRESYPSVPVILSSGYSVEGQATQILMRGCNGFLKKPFGLSELSEKIREILSQE